MIHGRRGGHENSVASDDEVIPLITAPRSVHVHPNAEVPRAALLQVRPSATLVEDRNVARELIALGAQRCRSNGYWRTRAATPHASVPTISPRQVL